MERTTSVRTEPAAADHRLRGRTYTIPFEDVWQGTLRLVRGKLRGWSLEFADDREGVVNALVTSPLRWLQGVVEIRISLDDDGWTRVEASAATPAIYHDFGLNARRLHRFFQRLDREAVREHQRRLPARRGGDSAAERSRPEAARPDMQAPARRGGDSAPERSRPEAARPDQQAPFRRSAGSG